MDTEPPTERVTHVAPVGEVPHQRVPTDPTTPQRRWIPFSIFGVLVVVAVVVGITLGNARGSALSAGSGITTSTPRPATGEPAYLAAVRTVSPDAAQFDDASLLSIGRAVCSQPAGAVRSQVVKDLAAYRKVSQGAAETIVANAVLYFCPTRAWSSPTTAVPATTAPPAIPATGPAKAITAREWQLIAKNPDQHKGERAIVYGWVRQFDSATGSDQFRASVDGVNHPGSSGKYDYETNTLLAGTSAASWPTSSRATCSRPR
ncbi:hypothetical protein GCM10009836_10580 [Pseudonocardia ailaonensis]|uniref:DUF732 domain-containing protein n=1 Tax=Pseudonocardia ailaonensis TaxID=367279 RepID=A0ABN2MQA4_9PSEU